MATTTEKKPAAETAPEPIEAGPYYTPAVDVLESNDGYTIYVDLPGVAAGDVDLTYEDEVLTLDAKVAPRQRQGRGYLGQEYGIGPFHRTFRLATPIDAQAIAAELKEGGLKLTVPKAESAKTRKIPIKTA